MGTDSKILSGNVEEQVRKLYRIIPEFIYGENEESLEMAVGRLLKERNATVCTAESCTGGKIAQLITTVPGSSSYFMGSVIAYNNSVKKKLLNIHDDLLKKYGAVSREMVEMMATGARDLLRTDFALATSGIAGPDGGTEEKPVGTIWIAVSSDKGIVSQKHVFGNDRIVNIKRFSFAALNLLRKQIIST
jgi:nicotinamide-nucleotide amidase